jgi:hypothetical protein
MARRAKQPTRSIIKIKAYKPTKYTIRTVKVPKMKITRFKI